MISHKKNEAINLRSFYAVEWSAFFLVLIIKRSYFSFIPFYKTYLAVYVVFISQLLSKCRQSWLQLPSVLQSFYTLPALIVLLRVVFLYFPCLQYVLGVLHSLGPLSSLCNPKILSCKNQFLCFSVMHAKYEIFIWATLLDMSKYIAWHVWCL